MIKITKKIMTLLAEKRNIMIIMVFMMLFGGILESVGVSMMLPLVTVILDESGWDQTWYGELICKLLGIDNQVSYIKALLIIVIIAFVLKNIYLFWEYYMQYSFSYGVRYDLQNSLMNKYMSKPYDFFLSSSTGDIIKTVTNDTSMVTTLLVNLLQLYTEVIVSVVLVITLFIINPQITFFLLCVLLAEMFFLVKILRPATKRAGSRYRQEVGKVNKWILQSISGIKSIKVANTEEYFKERYKEHAKKMVVANRKNQTYNKIPQLFIEACTVSLVLLMILVMVSLGKDLQSILPAFSAFVVAAIRLLPSVNRISSAMNNITYNEGALSDILEYIKEEDIYADASKQSVPEITFNQGIELRNIDFAYPERDNQVLTNAEMIIYPGESVGIVGVSGAGKTTTVDILLGLLKPQKGQVLVDGVDIEENMSGWLQHVSYIPQQIFLIDDSIRTNIAFGIPANRIDDNKVWEALSEAQLDGWVKELPQGINTVIGEAGIRLSGGQRQRMGIARALYTSPDILVFDEATSALDNDTERAIIDSVNHLKGTKTLIIIAHRLTTIENCDLIYRVKDGKIVKEK